MASEKGTSLLQIGHIVMANGNAPGAFENGLIYAGDALHAPS
jgi:hypothetical protein